MAGFMTGALEPPPEAAAAGAAARRVFASAGIASCKRATNATMLATEVVLADGGENLGWFFLFLIGLLSFFRGIADSSSGGVEFGAPPVGF